jgi:hypothetical protein
MSVAQAEVKAVVCRAQCLGISQATNTLRFLGHLTFVEATRLQSWKGLDKKCQARAKRTGTDGVLASSAFFHSDHSWNTNSSESSEVVYGYDYVAVSGSSSYSFYQNDVLDLEVDFAKANTSCVEEMVNEEDTVEEYDGDLPIFG